MNQIIGEISPGPNTIDVITSVLLQDYQRSDMQFGIVCDTCLFQVRGALFNDVFSVVVTADESGTVCVWNILNGHREGRFQKAHGDAKLTCMCFDKNQRRLVTAAGDGSVCMWNFNNGSLLRQYSHNDEKLEISTVSVWQLYTCTYLQH